jgi:hypothetical protein
MLYRDIISVFPENHTERINTFCGKTVEFLRVKLVDAYSNHKAVKGWSPGLQTYFVPYLAGVCFESSNTFMNCISISYQLDGKKRRPRALHWQQCNLHTFPIHGISQIGIQFAPVTERDTGRNYAKRLVAILRCSVFSTSDRCTVYCNCKRWRQFGV